MKSSFEELGGTYRQEGDYLLPNLTVPKGNHSIGVWGQRHRRYLKEHQKGTYHALLLAGKLYEYIAEIDEEAESMLERLVSQMAIAEGITEKLKADDQMEWVRRMSMAQSQASEIVYQELILK